MIGTRSRDGSVRILEDIVLGAITEVVEVGVNGWGKRTLVHVVSLLLEPVERVLGTVCTVTRRSVRDAVSRVSTASAGDLWCGQRNVRCRPSDVALESGHIILFAATVGGVDPEPCTVAPSRRARRHSFGNLEIGEPGPYARLVYAEDDKVLRFDGSDIRLVGDGEGASSQIVETGSVNGSQRGIGTGIITLSHIASWRRIEEGSCTLVTGDLGSSRLSSREFKEIARVGLMVEMTVEPPLVEGEIGERSDGTIVVRESFSGDVEAVHARVEEGGMAVDVNCEERK